MYALFILCTVFNTIVMLNLLIAIISETFSLVKENALNASYQEMASMIAENAYLIPEKIKRTYAEKNRNLMIVTDLEGEMEDDSDEVLQNIELLRKNMQKKIGSVSKDIKKIKTALYKQELWQEAQEYKTQQILAMLERMPANRDNDVHSSRNDGESFLGNSMMLGTGGGSNKMASLMRGSIKNTLTAKAMEKRFTMLLKKPGSGL